MKFDASIATGVQSRRCMFLPMFFTSDKGEVTCFCLCSFVCMSVCLLARLVKITCMDLDEMLCVDRCLDMGKLINF